MLTEAQRIGGMGSFELNLESRRLTWSEEMFRIVDVEPAAGASSESFLERVHPDDRERIDGLIRRAVEQGVAEPSRARLVRRNGDIRHVEMMAVVARGPEGKPASIRGTVNDVTDVVNLEAQLHQSQKMQAMGQLASGLRIVEFARMTTVWAQAAAPA
jgi:PAS domain-containing protein